VSECVSICLCFFSCLTFPCINPFSLSIYIYIFSLASTLFVFHLLLLLLFLSILHSHFLSLLFSLVYSFSNLLFRSLTPFQIIPCYSRSPNFKNLSLSLPHRYLQINSLSFFQSVTSLSAAQKSDLIWTISSVPLSSHPTIQGILKGDVSLYR